MEWSKRSIRSFSQTEYEGCLRLMTSERRKKVLAIPLEERRWATVLGEWMAKTMLAARCGLPMEEICILRTEKGRPYADGLPYFSISHSGEWVAVAVADKPVGIDIEQIRPADPRLAARIGAEPAHFWEEWTAKEAHFKIFGDPSFKNIRYADLAPLHFYEDGCIITIIKKRSDDGTYS